MYIPKDKYWVSLKMFELEEHLGHVEWWTSNFNVFESTGKSKCITASTLFNISNSGMI